MSGKLDLKQLAIDRDAPAGRPSSAGPPAPPRKRWLSRVGVPMAVVIGFATLIGVATGDRLWPVREVTVVPVVVKRSEVRRAGQPLFQAPGWIEPRPTPINVPALTAGVVESLSVVEGQSVEKGDIVATLISTDAELAVRRARATLAIRQGEHERARAELQAARLRRDNPVHLEVRLAEAESDLAAARSELEQLPHAIRSAEANLVLARRSAAGKRAAGEGVSAIARQRAEADLQAAEAKRDELRNRQPNLQAKTKALERRVAALERQLELLIEETRQLGEAEAKVTTAAALVEEAQLRLEDAELQLRRTTVRAPDSGRVLDLVASPGDRVMGLDSTAEHRSSTVIKMYDPERLQVRVDVRLEDVPLVTPGQPVTVETAASPAPIRGQVLQSTSAASVQKNTLEVKVGLADPPPAVTPEMLVTATFTAPQTDAGEQADATPQRLFVPAELVRPDGEQATVWVADAASRAQRLAIQTGASTEDGLVEVTSGLDVTHKLITGPTETLSQGERVRVVGDDPRLGLAKTSVNRSEG